MAGSKSYPKGSTPFRNADPIVLARALAAASINVRGTGRREVAKPPRSAEEADRTPNWDKWRLIPKLTASQCAALWANIDPDKLRYDGFKGCMESQEFKDRLDLVQANLYEALKSKNGKVDPRLFAAWVRGVEGTGWDAPAELFAIGDQRSQNVNWNHWGALDLWPLDAACKLISGYNPNEPTRPGDIENPDIEWVQIPIFITCFHAFTQRPHKALRAPV